MMLRKELRIDSFECRPSLAGSRTACCRTNNIKQDDYIAGREGEGIEVRRSLTVDEESR